MALACDTRGVTWPAHNLLSRRVVLLHSDISRALFYTGQIESVQLHTQFASHALVLLAKASLTVVVARLTNV